MTVGNSLYGLPEPERVPRPPSRWRWPIRIVLGAVAVMGVSIFTLSMIASNSDSMKESLEVYLGDITGREAKIGTLNAVSFFPMIGVDMDDLTLSESGRVVARFDHINFSTGFWGALAGRSSVRTLDVQDGKIDAGLLMPKAVTISRFAIDVEAAEQPRLVLDGEYGGDPVTFQAGLTRKIGIFGASSFDLAEDTDVKLQAGSVELSGKSGTGPKGERTILVESLKPGEGMATVKGSVSVFRRLKDIGFSGHFESGSSQIDFDVSILKENGFWAVTGKAVSGALNLEDVFAPKGLVDGYAALKAFYFGDRLKEVDAKPFDFSMLKVDVKTEIKALSNGQLALGSVSAPFIVEDGVLQFSPLTGEIKGGALGGEIRLDATSAPAQLSSDIHIKNLDYTSLSTLVQPAAENHGRADVKMELTAKGNNGDELWNDLDGKMMIVGGEGELSSPLISLWGGGLLNAMLPSFGQGDRLRLNCGIGDFEIADGIAQSKTLFLDTEGVTVVGDGTINLKKSTIDLKLEPKSKGTAFFSAATAVHLEGPLKKPSIDPDAFSLGKKLGGLFLGTINPAFLAFSLTDFGMTEQHPCQAYLKP